MRIKLVFKEWNKNGKPVLEPVEYMAIETWVFHWETTFNAEIKLKKREAEELQRNLDRGFQPVFWVKGE